MSSTRTLGSSAQRPITIAVLAMGGQGGGVLVDWIVDLAEHNGYLAQSTSVPGVAQRTGATIYYIELFALSHLSAQANGQTRQPVLALMPVPGEVDIVICSELMEAGRAMQRGLVTPDRTTLITSTHRDFATLEKVVPGNGIADHQAVLSAAEKHAQRFIQADMQSLAKSSGSVISAVLFGALSGANELPFTPTAYEETVQRAGVGVQASLKAFAAGAKAVAQALVAAPLVDTADPMATAPQPLPQRAASAAVEPLRLRIETQFPPQAHAMLGAGLQRVMEYQDIAYGTEYLDRMQTVYRADQNAGGAARGFAATAECARWLAVAMSYDDVIRVADLKTRPARFARVREEIGAPAGEIVGTVEFFHPRLEEIYGLLPPKLVRTIDGIGWVRKLLTVAIGDGKRIRPHTLRGQLMLQTMAGLRRWRRHSLRHATETEHIQAWMDKVVATLPVDYALAVEMLVCRRLVKGYSDTHARGSSKFDQLMRAATLLALQGDAAEQLRGLRTAALQDAKGDALRARWVQLGLPG
jgi:indolepyruvate ferredoxin oxidoreductase beta subunit